jgi:hypothetical protein
MRGHSRRALFDNPPQYTRRPPACARCARYGGASLERG